MSLETCRVNKAGIGYLGNMAKTTKGYICQRWDSQSPHAHNYTDGSLFPDGSLAEAANYCR